MRRRGGWKEPPSSPQLMRQAGLAQYMRPRQLVLCRAMPLGPSGKVLKREIRRLLLAGDPPDLLYLPDQAETETRGACIGSCMARRAQRPEHDS